MDMVTSLLTFHTILPALTHGFTHDQHGSNPIFLGHSPLVAFSGCNLPQHMPEFDGCIVQMEFYFGCQEIAGMA